MHAAAAVLGRDAAGARPRQCYMAVMIDDLTLHGVTEPYRMLTARAEYRLRLRANNASTRAYAAGDRSGLRGRNPPALVRDARGGPGRVVRCLRRRSLRRTTHRQRAAGAQRRRAPFDTRMAAFRWGRAWATWLPGLPGHLDPESAVAQEIGEDAAYAPYLARQDAELHHFGRAKRCHSAHDFPYCGGTRALAGNGRAPRSGAAGAISPPPGVCRGITPAALAALLVHARHRLSQAA